MEQKIIAMSETHGYNLWFFQGSVKVLLHCSNIMKMYVLAASGYN